MKTTATRWLLMFVLLPITWLYGQVANVPTHEHSSPGDRIGFVQNKGQWDGAFRFKAGLGGLNTLFLEDHAFTYVFHDEEEALGLHDAFFHSGQKAYFVQAHAYKVHFLFANTTIPQGIEKRIARYNFFLGNAPSRWASGVAVFDKIIYDNLYAGIDLIAYSEGQDFKYDFIVGAGADPKQIQLYYEGVESLRIVDDKLIIGTSVQTVQELQPYAYQIIHGEKINVPCEYTIDGHTLSFRFPKGYHTEHPLIIDPVVVASTLSGTSLNKNFGHSATFDHAGNIYTGGISFGPGYPTDVGSYQSDYGGGFTDICVSKYNPTGTQLLYATYIGGSQREYPHSLITDPNGQLYIYGSTESSNYPVTSNAFQTNHGGETDIIITALSADGAQLIGSTFMGGSSIDGQNISSHFSNYGDTYRGEIVLDPQGNVYVTSNTTSVDFPVSDDAFDIYYNDMWDFTAAQDAVVFKLNSDLSYLYWSTFLGGDGADTGAGLRLDDAYNVYVTGTAGAANFPMLPTAYQANHLGGEEDAYVVKLSNDGSSLLSATFFGTTANEHSYFIDLDESDNIHIYGQTTGTIAPSPAGTYSTNNNSTQFLAAFDKDLSNLIYQTNIGTGPLPPGSGVFPLVPVAFMVDKCDNIYISGYYAAEGLPTTADAILPSGDNIFYLAVLEPLASGLSYATYYGNADHVDGGTSRFDKAGTVYQAVCSCTFTNQTMNTNPDAWSTSSTLDCDVGVFKIDFEVPTLTAAAVAIPGSSGCAPFGVQFNYTGQGAENYFWDFGDGYTSSLSTPYHTYSEAGAYTLSLIASSPNACNIADTFYLQIDVLDNSSSLLDTAICTEGSTIILDATTQNAQYTWQDGYTGASYEVTSSGTYWVEVSIDGCSHIDSFVVNDASGISLDLGEDIAVCDQTTFLIQADVDGPVESYLWNTGSQTSEITVSQTGTYSVVVVDTVGCSIEDDITLSFGTTPVFELGTYDTLCPSETLLLDLSGFDDVSYLWQDNSTADSYTVSSAGSYYVTLDNNGCTYSDTAIIHYFDVPVYQYDLQNIICASECNGLAGIESNNAQLSFLWNTGSTDSHLYELCEGNYSVTITDGHGCTYMEDFTILNPAPLSLETEAIPVVCYGDNNGAIAINELSGGFPPYTYILNGDTLSGNGELFQLSGGDYQLVVSDAGGCTISDTLFIYEPPYIDIFAGDDRQVDLGDTLHINGWVIPPDDQVLSWNPTAGFMGCLDCPTPVVQPIQSLNYVLTALDTVTNCVRRDTVRLLVDLVRKVYIPNAFSPNGDGINDLFMIYTGPGVQQINSLKIFDRWGELIIERNNFPANDRHYGWNGRFRGKMMNNAVFAYMVEVAFIDGQVRLYKGDVTLLR